MRRTDCIEQGPLSGATRKSFAHTEFFSDGPLADQRRPVVNIALASPSDGLAATTAFGCRSIDSIGVEAPACVISAALQTYCSNVSYLPHCRRIPTFKLTAGLRVLPCFFQPSGEVP
jgi:hypothetical protein